MLSREFTMHMTPLSYKLRSLKVQSFHFPFCFGRLQMWPLDHLLFFQALTYDWGPITTEPVWYWSKRYPLTAMGPVKHFTLGSCRTWHDLWTRGAQLSNVSPVIPFWDALILLKTPHTLSDHECPHTHTFTTFVALNTHSSSNKFKVTYSGISATYGEI